MSKRGEGIQFHVAQWDMVVRARWRETNGELIRVIKANVPTRCLFSHVVVSGQSFGAVTRIRFDGRGVMVPRAFGSVFFYQPSQKINLCYGEVTESARVNQFAEVIEEDFDRLKVLGARVWQRTVMDPVRENVYVDIKEWKGQ